MLSDKLYFGTLGVVSETKQLPTTVVELQFIHDLTRRTSLKLLFVLILFSFVLCHLFDDLNNLNVTKEQKEK